MEKYFVTHPQAVDLKELGFDEPCIAYFNGKYHDYKIDDEDGAVVAHINPNMNIGECLNRPLKSQVFEWFRDKQNLRSNIMDFIDDVTGIEWDYEIDFIGVDVDENGNYKPLVDYSIDDETRKFKTYKEAESACIDKLIEIVKNK